MSDGLKLIASAIIAGSAAAITGTPLDLFEEEERPVAEFARSYIRQYRDVPQAATVHTETGVRLPRADEPVAYYVDKVYERHQYNQIRDRFGELRTALSAKDMPGVSAAVNDMARATRTTTRRGTESMTMGEAMSRYVEWMDQTVGSGGITGIVSGWPDVDQKTGGYQKTDIISIVGRPGLGKTYIALQQAYSAYQAGETVLFVTTEMGGEAIGRRQLSIGMGIDPDVLKKNTVSTRTRARIREYVRSMDGIDRFRLFSVGMKSGVDAVEALMQEFMPSIVFIDGVYLLKPSHSIGRINNRQERVTAVYDELKGIALDADLPMILTTQFNRQAGKGGVDGSLENVGYTDAIGTHSSSVIAIKTGPTQNPYHSRYLDFLKGREGEAGKVAINFKFAPLDMSQMTPEQLAQTEAAEGGGPTGISEDWMT